MKKFFITLMCIVMVVCFMPTVAFADSTTTCSSECDHAASITVNAATTHYDTLQEAVNAATDGSETTIKLLKNVEENIQINSGKIIVLDLDGHVLTDNGDNTIKSKGTLYLKSSTNGGSVVNHTAKRCALYTSGGALKVENVSIRNVRDCNKELIYISNNTDAEIISGIFTQNASKNLLYASAKKDVVIKGGTFIQNGDYEMIYSYDSGTRIVIEGGTFTNNGTKQMLCLRYSGKYSISDGTFNGGSAEILPNSSDCGVTGGKFSNPVNPINCVVGYAPTKVAVDGYYCVIGLTDDTAAVVLTYINEESATVTAYYADPAVALADSFQKTGATVTITKDVTVTSDLNAYKSKLVVNEGATLTCKSIMVSINGTSGRTVENNGTINASSYIDGLSGSGILVNNGTIICSRIYESCNCNWVNNSQITVTGASSTSTPSKLSAFTNNGTIKGSADGVKMTVINDVTGAGKNYAKGSYVWDTVNNSWMPAGKIRIIREGTALVGFDSLADAVNYAQDGDTLQLQDNQEKLMTVTGKNLILDLNGYCISFGNCISDTGVVTLNNGAKLTVIDNSDSASGRIVSKYGLDTIYVKSGTEFVLKRGTIENKDDTCSAIYIGNTDIGGNASDVGATSAVVNLDGGQVKASGHGVVICGTGSTNNPQSTDPALNISSGSTINTDATAIMGNGMYHNTIINISGGQINSANEVAIYHPQYGKLNVTGGSIIGATGIEMRSGTLNVSDDAVITGTASEFLTQANGSGNTVLGAGIAISQHTTNLPISVTIRENDGRAPVITGIYSIYEKDFQDSATENVNLSVSGGSFSGTGGTAIFSENCNGFITGGTFSSDVIDYMSNDCYEYAMRNGTYIVKASGAEEPAFTTGNYWSDLVGKVYTEMYSAPYVPSTPSTPTDNVTNSGTAGTDNATTSADLSGSTTTSNDTTATAVDKTTADKIVDKAVANKSQEVVIDATANTAAAAASTTVAQVTIPTETLGAIAEKTEADVTIKTDVAEVKMDNAAAAAVSEQATGDTVQIVAEKVKEDAEEVHFELKVVCSNGTVISDFKGGNVAVTVTLPKEMADKKVVCVYIDDNGHMSKVEGQKNADGTYTFVTGHFSTYAIMAEEEADAAIAAQTEAIKNIKIKLTSKQVKTKSGKKGIKITWTAAEGDKVLDGVEVFRSKEKNKGYGTKAFFTSTKGGNKGSYINTKSLKKGTRYYYKVRGYVLVNGEKVYTDYSTKAWRTA